MLFPPLPWPAFITRQVKQQRLGADSSDAFFKLTLDLGLSADQAHSVRKAVTTVK